MAKDLRAQFSHYSKTILRALRSPIILYYLIAGNLVLSVCSIIFYWLEKGKNEGIQTLGDAFWWAFCTVSTVGFGDIVPATDIGRVIGVMLIVTGAFFFVGFTSLITTVIVASSTKEIIKTEEKSEALTLKEFQEMMRAIERLTQKVDSLEKKS